MRVGTERYKAEDVHMIQTDIVDNIAEDAKADNHIQRSIILRRRRKKYEQAKDSPVRYKPSAH